MLSLYKNYLAVALSASLASVSWLEPAFAAPDGITASGPAALSKLQSGSTIQCPPNDAACNKCKGALPGIYSRTKSAVDAAVAKDGASAASGAAGATGAGKAANGAQENSASMGSLGAGLGAGGLTGRAGASGEAATAFNKCVSDIDQNCAGVAQADKAKQACQEGATAAGQSAADQGKGAGDMSQLASMLGQMAQALGPLMAQKDQPQSSIAPETTTPAKLPQVTGTSLGSDKESKGGQIGFGNSGSAKSEEKVAGSGENHQGFGRINSDPALASSLGGSSTEGGFNTSGASIGSGQPSAAGGGLGAGDGTGASMMGEVPPAPKAAEASGNEYPSGGGGGSRPSFLGLKGKSGESEPGAEGEAPLGGLGLDEGSRELASSEENAAGIHPEDMGGSLFNVVHTKYVEIKQKGNI